MMKKINIPSPWLMKMMMMVVVTMSLMCCVGEDLPLEKVSIEQCVDPPLPPGMSVQRYEALRQDWTHLSYEDTIWYALDDKLSQAFWNPNTQSYTYEPLVDDDLLNKLQVQYDDCMQEFTVELSERAVELDMEAPVFASSDDWDGARVRNSFVQGNGTWSYLGTIIDIPQLKGLATMNVGWWEIDNRTGLPSCRHIVHEWAHTFGYPHMQNHPGGVNGPGFVIDTVAYMAAFPDRTVESITREFDRYPLAAFNFFPYDRLSLLQYWYLFGHYLYPTEEIEFTWTSSEQDWLMYLEAMGRPMIVDPDDPVPPIVTDDCPERETLILILEVLRKQGYTSELLSELSQSGQRSSLQGVRGQKSSGCCWRWSK